MDDSLDQGFRLGDVQVYPLETRIVGPDGDLAVSPAAMEILVNLAQGQGKPVSSHYLITQTWGKTPPAPGTLQHYVAELNHLLAKCQLGTGVIIEEGAGHYLLQIRVEAIEAVSGGPRLLRELLRRKVTQTGALYLVASWLIIQVVETTFPALGFGDFAVRLVIITAIIGFPIALLLSWFYDIRATDANVANAPSGTGLRFIVIAAIVALPIALTYQWYFGVDEASESGSTPVIEADSLQPNSIAVLAFLNLSGGERYDYFGDGIADEILNTLSRTGKMLVIPRTSSFAFKDTGLGVPQIGANLGVRYVLDGSVRRIRDKVRINAQLTDVVSGFQVWSQTYDKRLSDIFGVQQDIARQVVRSLEIALAPDKNAILGAASTSNIKAFDYYLQGRDYLHQPSSDATAFSNAAQMFDRAIQTDRNYADAYAGLCESYIAQYNLLRSTSWFSRAEEACKSALRFDVVTADMRVALGNLYRESGRYELAEAQLAKALDIEPENIHAIDGMAETYAASNRGNEAEMLFRRVIELQPGYWRGHSAMGNFLFRSGRAADSVRHYERVIELVPDHATAHSNLGAAYLMQADFKRAEEAWQRSLKLEPTDVAYSNRGTSLFFLRRFDEAVQMYRQATELAPDNYTLWGNLGDAARFGSTPADAIDYYKRASLLAERALDVNPLDAETQAKLAHYQANVGIEERAAVLIETAVQEAPDNMYVAYYAALTWATLDDRAKAAESARKALVLGYPEELLLADAGLDTVFRSSEFRRASATPGAR